MKKALIIVFAVLCGAFKYETAQAQIVSFCESVLDDGQMVNQSNTFAITQKGGTIHMLITLEDKVGVSKVIYKVFRVSDKGDQYIDQSLEDIVDPKWMWFHHELIIRSPGNYMVYVYPENSTKILASGLVHIISAKE